MVWNCGKLLETEIFCPNSNTAPIAREMLTSVAKHRFIELRHAKISLHPKVATLLVTGAILSFHSE